MDKKLDFKTFKEEALQNAAFKSEYEKLRAEFELVRQFIKARKKAKVSQEVLAERLKLQQSAIARLEGGGYAKTSIANLSKIASALGYSLEVSLKVKKRD